MDKPPRLGGKRYLVKAVNEEHEAMESAQRLEEAKMDNDSICRDLLNQQKSYMHTHLRYLTNWMIFPYEEYDYFKHSFARCIGYTHELGEAFRGFVPNTLLRAMQGISAVYVLYDAKDKYRGKDKERNSNMVAVGDTLIWHGLASFIIPNLVIKSTTISIMDVAIQKKARFARYLPSVIALMAIPLIMNPIDRSVDFVMSLSRTNNSYKPVTLNSYKTL